MAAKRKKSTPEKRTLILWALLARDNAGAFQNELKPKPLKADRDALSNEGLIKSEKKRGRRIWIEVTDKGWEWAGKNLGAALPAKSAFGSQILQAWLSRLKAFMDARGLVLADILGPQGAAPANAAPTDRAESLASALDYAAVRQRIRQAYLDITGGQLNTRALLRDIREKLKDIEPGTLDDVLKKMHLEEGTTLSGLNNPQEVTQEIRAAGLDFKGERMFALWITK